MTMDTAPDTPTVLPDGDSGADEGRDIHSGARIVLVADAARRAGVDRKTVDRWIKQGKLQAFSGKAGRRVRLDETERLASESRRVAGRGQSHGNASGEVEALRGQVATLTEALSRSQEGEHRALLMLPEAIAPVREELTNARAEVERIRRELADATSERIALERRNAQLEEQVVARRGFWRRVLGR